MGLFDDVKDSISGSDSENNDGGFNDNKFDNSFTSGGDDMNGNDDPLSSPQNQGPQNGPQGGDMGAPGDQGDPFDSGGVEPNSPLDDGRGGGQPPAQNDNLGNNTMNNSGAGQNDFQPQSGNLGGGKNESPNPRAGRPQEGGSSPQLSSDTRQEMEQAGFNLNDDQRGGQSNSRDMGGSSGRGGLQPQSEQDQQGFDRSGSVADNRDDLEEIKSQNEQIIELLKRISDALNSDQGARGGGSARNRHGGRR
jgi:hypothetical protein